MTVTLNCPVISFEFIAGGKGSSSKLDRWVLTCPISKLQVTASWLHRHGCKFQGRVSTDRRRAEFEIEIIPSALVKILVARHYPEAEIMPLQIERGYRSILEREAQA